MKSDLDICFVIPPQNKGWILDHIPHEIGIRHNGMAEYCYRYGNLPIANVYWLSHYSILPEVLDKNPHIRHSQCVVFFTHTSSNLEQFSGLFNLCKAIVAENPFYAEELKKAGVKEEKIHWIPEASDPEMFKAHKRGNGSILISGSYRRRKNFEQILEVIKLMPTHNFILVTQLLEKWEKVQEFRELPNVTIYEEMPYDKYPEIYEKCDVYLSCSLVEGGGPNSLIEAMHCDMVPVVSNVGNASEFIINGYNGFVFDHPMSSEKIVELVKQAYEIKTNVSDTVSSYTWENYAEAMLEILLPEKYHNEKGLITKYVD